MYVQVFEDLYHYMQSLATILALKPSLIYPGHGPVVNDPLQHVTMYVNNRNMRESQIIEALTNNGGSMEVMDLVRIIYNVSWNIKD